MIGNIMQSNEPKTCLKDGVQITELSALLELFLDKDKAQL